MPADVGAECLSPAVEAVTGLTLADAVEFVVDGGLAGVGQLRIDTDDLEGVLVGIQDQPVALGGPIGQVNNGDVLLGLFRPMSSTAMVPSTIRSMNARSSATGGCWSAGTGDPFSDDLVESGWPDP